MSKQDTSCRLSVLLARDAPRAVILRRGPTRRVQLILWHTDTDVFEEGQWFHGRIYEGASDLSPDGSLFLYLARKNQTPEREASRTTHKWTAISRPPYYTALALWPIGDEWDGGGMFLDNKSIWLCHQPKHLKHLQHPKLAISASFNPSRLSETLIRDGWHIQRGHFDFERLPDNFFTHGLAAKGITLQPYVCTKHSPDQGYRLVKELYREPDFSVETLAYLVDETTNEQHLIDGTTWIDWDHRGRLVFAREGKLFASIDLRTPLQTQEIADFNANIPESIVAPAWAHQW